MTRAYYNEFDPAAARWLRELMRENLIPPGVVDERSIRDVCADDLRGFDQVHFCAGIGVWPYALRRAGWDDARPVGTGSFPCQPFSAAGKGGGFADDRHIWPEGHRLIRDARQQGQRWAHRLFGEQAATAGAWIDLVRTDLERLGYAFASPDLAAAGFGGAHIRQRFYWVADADNAEWWSDLAPRHIGDWQGVGRVETAGYAAERGAAGGVDIPPGRRRPWVGSQPAHGEPVQAGEGRGGVADGEGVGRGEERPFAGRLAGRDHAKRGSARPGDGGGDCDWLPCLDGHWRPVEPGTFPLADEAPARVGRLRGYGNALDAETATNFVAAYMEAAGEASLHRRLGASARAA